MKRMTVEKGGIVFYLKNGQPIPPIRMDNFDMYRVVRRLAEYEKKEEEAKARGGNNVPV